MSRTVRNNPPRPQPRDSNQSRSREPETSRTPQTPRTPRTHRAGGPRQRHQDDVHEVEPSGAGRLSAPTQPAGVGAALPPPGFTRRMRRRARQVFRSLIMQDVRPENMYEARMSHRSVQSRQAFELRALEAATRGAQNRESDLFESARDDYLASIDYEVITTMDESIRAVGDVLRVIMKRETGPGLVPADIIYFMGRGLYAIPAMALTHALPTLCLRRGYSCGLRLFEERHLTPDPKRPENMLMRVFEACAQLCNTRDSNAMMSAMQTWAPTLARYIDEDWHPESQALQLLIREVFSTVHYVKGTYLSAVLQAAAKEFVEE